jgi:hypothetical protein
MTEEQCSALLHSKQISDFEICDPQGLRRLTATDLPPAL